ncbi:MAG: diguanylate cyclase [Nitrospiraceae bacterium]|nr:MAG: diguanylate cyclase [Nitrospiraceae bacterium]
MKKKVMNRGKKRIAGEIRKLLLNALKQKDWYFFNNPQLCRCWEEMNCSNTSCPSYESPDLRCWQISGTFCKDNASGEFAKRIGDCLKCQVYRKATEGSFLLQIGEDFNNLMFHLKAKEDELRAILETSEDKNRELEALNEKIKKLVDALDRKNTLLRELSIKDGLTGLYNYRFFREILHEQFNLSKRFNFPLSCVIVDVDYFKAVNDTYGHQRGDAILTQLAEILQGNVREADKVVRYGGEEFVMVLPYTDHDAAFIKAERLRAIVSEYPFAAGDTTVGVTISLGITSRPHNRRIKKAEHLVSYADKALYQAKQMGRNRSVLYAEEGPSLPGRTKAGPDLFVAERREQPRVRVMVRAEGTIGGSETFSGRTFDISYSGLSLLNSAPAAINSRVKIILSLPGPGGNGGESMKVGIEGIVVWSRQVNACQGKQRGRNNASGLNYMIGVQFIAMAQKDRVILQKYFLSLFKGEYYTAGFAPLSS